MRELFGILTTEKAHHAILVTTGRFTQDARAFAAGKPLELIEGNRLDALIRQASSGGSDLLDVASWSGAFAQAAMITTPPVRFAVRPWRYGAANRTATGSGAARRIHTAGARETCGRS